MMGIVAGGVCHVVGGVSYPAPPSYELQLKLLAFLAESILFLEGQKKTLDCGPGGPGLDPPSSL